MRADLVMLRAARAFAAWHDAPQVLPEHVDAVAELVLVHRRKPGVAVQPPLPSPAREPAGQDASQEQSSRQEDRNAESSSETDWGYMPPQPVPLQRSDSAQSLMSLRAGVPAPKKA